MKEIKEFVDMMHNIEDNHSNTIEFKLLCRIMQSQEWKALKAIADRPVSEDRMPSIVKWAYSPGEEQPTDTQDNDGWIKHRGREVPQGITDETELEIESIFFGDDNRIRKLKGKNIYKAWWIWEQWHSRIIAYRIIDEPKEGCDVCEDAYVTGMKDEIKAICKWCEEEIKGKEPKKQTLLEFMRGYRELGRGAAQYSEREIVLFGRLGEYLEQNK